MLSRAFSRISILLLIPSSLGAVIGIDAPAATNVIDLGYATYQGSFNPNTTNTQFLGIRFAAPPTGTLRWRAPQQPATIAGVQLANEFPNRCLAGDTGNRPNTPFRTTNSALQSRDLGKRAVPIFSEDCLFLNVWIPGTLSKAKNLPVIVFIHGGGYVSGSSSGFSGTDTFDGDDLIREAGAGVVAVTIQYRLGVFGFLAGQKVKDDGALNVGLLDQQFALRWIQQHIAKFGGDPRKVTIWGESAGAGSVLQQVISNGGKTTPPLFRGAISSSSFLPSQYKFNDPIPEKIYDSLISMAGCSPSNDTLACLRTADPNLLETANVNITLNGFFGTFVTVPVIDGTFITESPTELFKQHKVNGEFLLAVTNTFEGAAFVDSSTASTVTIPDYITQLFPHFGSREIAAAVAQYQGLGAPIDQAIAIMGESIFICPTYLMLSAFPGRSFKGEFAIPPGGHGNDVAYYFPTTQNANGIPPFNNTAFDKAFSESFLNFAMSLNPNTKWDPTNITPRWNAWNGGNEMLFNRTASGDPEIHSIKTSEALLQRCDFWQSVGALSGQ